jgi:hypothetical protein
MSSKSKFVAGARWLAMPIVRPIEQAMESSSAIRDDLARVRAAREARRRQQEQEREHLSAADLEDPAKIKNDAQRFEAYYKLRGWTEDELTAQLGAFKVTKRACVVVCLLMMIVAILGLFYLPGIVQLLMCPVILTIAAAMAAMGFKYGLLQSQLEERRLHKPADYVARDDFFWHMLWG